MGMKISTLTLLNRDTGEISIEAAYGLSASQKRRGRYKLGEGITGKVIQTGKPALVPRISEEPQFLDRTGARTSKEAGELSFVCVPIKIGREVIGGAERRPRPDPRGGSCRRTPVSSPSLPPSLRRRCVCDSRRRRSRSGSSRRTSASRTS